MQKFMFKVSSVSDVITNSSTEVYMVRQNDEFKQLYAKHSDVDLILFDKEKTVKEFIRDDYDDRRLSRMDFFLTYNPISEIDKDAFEEKCGKTFDDLWEVFKKPYLSMIGYAYGEWENSNWDDSSRYFSELAENNGVTELY